MVHVMSEAIRFDPVGTIEGWEESEFGQYCFACDLEDAQAQFDAQRLRADTAEAELQALRLVFENAEDCELNDAELKLAAAEQRIAELTDVERITMAILGKDADPAPGINWVCDRMWAVNDVRERVRAALNPEAENHELAKG